MPTKEFSGQFIRLLGRSSRNLSFTFNTFSNGLSNDPRNWKTQGYYSAGLDLIGIKDIGGTPIGGRQNTLQLSQNLVQDKISAGGSSAQWHVTGLVEWIRRWDALNMGDLYAFAPTTSASNTGVFLRNVSGNTTWVSSHTTLQSNGGGGLGVISANLYYGQNQWLGQLTSALAFNDSFGSFTIGAVTPRPMKVFAGVLNVGNDNYISTVDASGNFTQQALTLPSGFVVRSLEANSDYLWISADNNNTSRIFIWTGGTATFQESYDIPEYRAPLLVMKDGRIIAVGNQIYQLNETSYQTLFPYSYYGTGVVTSPTAAIETPTLGEIHNWRNRIIYSLDQPNGGLANADDAGGIWMIGQTDPTNPLINHLAYILPVSSYLPYNVNVGGIYADESGLLKVGYNYSQGSTTSGSYGIATFDSIYKPVNSAYAYYITLPMDMDLDQNKLFQSIRVNMQGTSNASASIAIYYRLNVDFSDLYSGLTDANWTLLRTMPLGTTSYLVPTPIRQKARNIQFKFVFTGNSTNTPQLLDYTLLYRPLDEYR